MKFASIMASIPSLLAMLSLFGMAAGAAQQLSVSTRRRPAVPGMLAFASHDDEKSMLVNSDPQAAEVWTCVIDTGTNSVTYGLNLTSPATSSVTYTADSSTSTSEVATGLAAAWNADPVCRQFGKATVSTATITITGVVAGVAFDVAEDESSSLMTLTNTTNAAEADSVPFGRAMLSTSYQSNEPERLGVLAKSSKLTAQVETLTVVYAASEVYYVTITIEGEEYTISVVGDTDSATTGAAIVTRLNAILPAVSVLASGTSTVTLTAELAGKAFTVGIGTQSGTASRLVLTHTTATPATDITKVIAGVSLVASDIAPSSLTDDTSQYPPNSGVVIVKHGNVWVENTETITEGAAVYIELDGTGSNAGKFYASTSATRVKMPTTLMRWRRSDHDASGPFSASDGNVAQLSVNLAA